MVNTKVAAIAIAIAIIAMLGIAYYRLAGFQKPSPQTTTPFAAVSRSVLVDVILRLCNVFKFSKLYVVLGSIQDVGLWDASKRPEPDEASSGMQRKWDEAMKLISNHINHYESRTPRQLLN